MNDERAQGDGRLSETAAEYDVVIIGAGINGCGVFRDLCAQGVTCLLIDRADFCAGASAAPSRLIHGGIKYLETGEFRLVRESVLERNRLLRNASHYVKPLETVIPIHSRFGGILPSIKRFLGLKAKVDDRGALITKLGLSIYDACSRRFKVLPGHRMVFGKAVRSLMPGLTQDALAAGIYYEGRVSHAERLALELVLDGLADEPGASALNHVSVVTQDAEGLLLQDCLTGEERHVRARVVVNAGGAWIDRINTRLGIASSHMGGSKGSHVIVDNRSLFEALDGRMVYFGSADGRVNLLYPFMGNVLIGSTDIAVDDPDDVRCDAAEMRYLLSVVREVFPDIQVQPREVVMSYCGVRPLPRSQGKDIGAVSRDHSIEVDALGDGTPVYALIGGKWTTFRAFSEQAADLALERLGLQRHSSTRDMPIGGGRDFPASDAERAALERRLASTYVRRADDVRRLLDRYGTRAGRMMADIAGASDEGMASLPNYTSAEIAWLCRHEKVGRLSDLLFRRTAIALSGQLTRAAIDECATIAAAALGWSSRRREEEVRLVLQACESHAIVLEKARSAPGESAVRIGGIHAGP